jgi:hypothetical protein
VRGLRHNNPGLVGPPQVAAEELGSARSAAIRRCPRRSCRSRLAELVTLNAAAVTSGRLGRLVQPDLDVDPDHVPPESAAIRRKEATWDQIKPAQVLRKSVFLAHHSEKLVSNTKCNTNLILFSRPPQSRRNRLAKLESEA